MVRGVGVGLMVIVMLVSLRIISFMVRGVMKVLVVMFGLVVLVKVC